MTRADAIVERGARGLQRLSQRAAASGGVGARLAPELADDAAFLRKLKPSLMVARVRGEAPTNQKPGEPRAAPAGPQLGARPKPRSSGGPNPWVVVGIAFVVGIALAKAIDWRSHAHPRD